MLARPNVRPESVEKVATTRFGVEGAVVGPARPTYITLVPSPVKLAVPSHVACGDGPPASEEASAADALLLHVEPTTWTIVHFVHDVTPFGDVAHPASAPAPMEKSS